ncbi:MAG: diphosphomevalonate decarboxylase [Flavobacteriales bacterium]|nr:MAG: diphosphomevalonate decarboxylase [Flavobacteriales bacterium]
MKKEDFIYNDNCETPLNGSSHWESPSNIALVKYWGKSDVQIPKNTSISFTLNKCLTSTKLEFVKKTNSSELIDFDIYYDDKLKEDFKPKIQSFFDKIIKYCPYILNYKFKINTFNTFPHSSGIASSASGISALALCIMSLEQLINPKITDKYFFMKASFLARLGSGSACRSLKGRINLWGYHSSFSTSSDLYSIDFPNKVDDVFNTYHDAVLLVDKGIKTVSSTAGHNLMNNHPFADKRFQIAQENIDKLSTILKNGDTNEFVKIVENEALMLHGLMMTSNPSYILIKSKTLQIIESIREFRLKNKIPVCFTLDAGANVHVLFPDKYSDEVYDFIESKLKMYCENNSYIKDCVGFGAKQL